MLINLSSELEQDPAKFTNNFTEIIEIPPNSYICLVKGSIIREKNQKQVSIPPDTDLFIRYTAYDIARLRLNPAGNSNQILSVEAFVNDINSRFGAVGFAYSKAFRAVQRESDDGDLAMDLVFYHETLPADVSFTLENEIFGNSDARITKFSRCFGSNNQILPSLPNFNAGANISHIYSDTTEWCAAPIWDTTYRTLNTNQNNGNSFCTLIDQHALPNLQNNGYAPMQWFINQPNTNFNIAVGSTTSDTNVPSQVLTGPVQGTAQGGNPADKLYIANISFDIEDDGFLQAAVYNRDTDDFEPGIATPYNPADYFEYFFRANETPPIEFGHCMYSNLIHYRANGLVFLYNGNLGVIGDRPLNNNFFLSSNTTNPTTSSTELNNMSYPYSNEHLKNLYYKQDNGNLAGFADQFIADFKQTQINLLSGNACLGVRGMNGFENNNFAGNNYVANGSGWVYNQTNGRPGTKQFTSAYVTDGAILNQWRYSTGVQCFDTRDGVKRPDAQVIEIPNVYRINSLGGIVNSCPTLIAFSATFDLAAEAQFPDNFGAGQPLNANLRTLCGNDTGKLFEVQLNQANTAMPAGWDFRLTDNAGNTYVNILVDGAGNRINFRSSTNTNGYTYNFQIVYYGPTTNSFRILVDETTLTGNGAAADMTTTLFQSQGPIMPLNADADFLANLNCWGGINPLLDSNTMTNYNNYSPLTYLCNFRVYQLCTREGTDDTIFDLQRNAMLSYFRSHPVYSAIDANDTFWIANTDENRPSLIDFYPNTTNQFILPTAAMGTNDNYNTTGISRPESNVNVIIQKLGTDAPSDPNSPVLNSLHIPPNQIINNSRRFTNLGQLDYAGYGEGLVNLTEADLILDFIAPKMII